MQKWNRYGPEPALFLAAYDKHLVGKPGSKLHLAHLLKAWQDLRNQRFPVLVEECEILKERAKAFSDLHAAALKANDTAFLRKLYEAACILKRQAPWDRVVKVPGQLMLAFLALNRLVNQPYPSRQEVLALVNQWRVESGLYPRSERHCRRLWSQIGLGSLQSSQHSLAMD